MKAALLWACAVLLWGCGADANTLAPETPLEETSADETPVAELPAFTAPNERPDGTQFADVLAQYQALNTRLERVAFDLQSANAPLCPVTARDVGYTVHSAGDYPENLRGVAREMLNVDERLSIRTVRPGSPAARAGLLPGDRIAGIDGQRLAAGMTQKLFYDRAAKNAFAKSEASVTIVRSEAVSTAVLRPETLCGYPVNVFFNENVNGHTDGEVVWITSELMRTVPDDVNLSLIVAHEMAHAIAGHMAMTPDKSLELLADRMALVMMARANLDIARAVDYWDAALHPHYELQENSVTHPAISERRDNLADALSRIKKAQAAGLDLDFNIIE